MRELTLAWVAPGDMLKFQRRKQKKGGRVIGAGLLSVGAA